MFIQAFPPNYEQFLFAYLFSVISRRIICIHTCYAILFSCAIFKYFSCSHFFFIIQNCSSNDYSIFEFFLLRINMTVKHCTINIIFILWKLVFPLLFLFNGLLILQHTIKRNEWQTTTTTTNFTLLWQIPIPNVCECAIQPSSLSLSIYFLNVCRSVLYRPTTIFFSCAAIGHQA